jgi:ectoine hydroxylase-related dioxygenase (phytanoyl-CoA dioxygenase family)
MNENKLLTNSHLEEFQQNGYILLKGILDPVACKQFDLQSVQPALREHARIDPHDPTSWNTDTLKSMATGDYDEERANILPGVMVRKVDGSDPIADDHNLDLSALAPILDQLHGDPDDWEWIHENVGWIHVRFPLDEHQPKFQRKWHVDGGHFTPHFLDSEEQSIVVLPMIRPVGVGGGNTLVLNKSHIYMAQKLAQAGEDGIAKQVTQDCNEFARIWPDELISEVAPCEAGDVLLMHPFLIHAAGQASAGHPLRIAFNMGVKWRRKPIVKKKDRVDETCGWLENSITWALNQSLDFLDETIDE